MPECWHLCSACVEGSQSMEQREGVGAWRKNQGDAMSPAVTSGKQEEWEGHSF